MLRYRCRRVDDAAGGTSTTPIALFSRRRRRLVERTVSHGIAEQTRGEHRRHYQLLFSPYSLRHHRRPPSFMNKRR